jgi:3-deoxy-manno-octulosonate cytidylyltransferase (CMP-KDO synthetase)
VSRFIVIVPARLASTRLPRKPLADIGGIPMVVRVARAASGSGAARVVVAADSGEIVAACAAHGIEALLTRSDHATGTDRLAEAVTQLGLADDSIVVNVQGDEPLMPAAVVRRVAEALTARADCEVATACHALLDASEFFSPNVVKVVTDANGRALYFSRAPIPWSRDAFAASRDRLPPDLPARRHVGLYAYRAGFLRRFPQLPATALEQHESLEQLRALAHGIGIAVVELSEPLPPGVDTAEDLARVRAMLHAGD